MKKLLFVFAVAAFAACNDSASTDAPKADSTAIQAPAPDSAAVTTPDSTLKADSTAPAAADTTAKPAAH